MKWNEKENKNVEPKRKYQNASNVVRESMVL